MMIYLLYQNAPYFFNDLKQKAKVKP